MRDFMDVIKALADVQTTVLITGESGTGSGPIVPRKSSS